MKPKSKRPKPKQVTASAAILEAKKNAQAQAKRVTRSSSGSTNNNSTVENIIPEPEIVVMKDHLQPARDMKGVTRKATGVVYDMKMLEHYCIWDPQYPEKPERLSAVIDRCQQLGLIDRCTPILPRYARQDEVLTVHTQDHFEKLKSICETDDVTKMEDFASNYDAVYIHPSTYQLSLLSVGCTVDLVDSVLAGKIQNGMALIRPPGHHAMKSEYCGYCYFNNVAIAAKKALDSGNASRVLIVDFDVHHGQATQQMFYDDKRVLYFSTHRYEHGTFWPNLKESEYNFIGSEDGLGFNCNVPLNKTGLGNEDFLTIWHRLLLPMAYEFNPDLVIISAGFDCVYGCFEGEMELTPQCIPHLLSPLLGLAEGKVAVILEGGYCIKSLAEGAALALRTLLGDPCPIIPKIQNPSPVVAETILNSTYMLRPYWNMLKTTQLTTEESASLLQEKGRVHKPEIRFEWAEPKPDKYPTRGFYPTQTLELKRTIDLRLDSLRLSTNLAKAKSKVGIVYDDVMLRHRNLQELGHPETPERISNIYANHADYGLLERCERLKSREVTEEELLLIHTKEHIELMKKTQNLKQNELEKMQQRFNSIFLNNSSYQSALVAAGSVLEVVDNVLQDNCQSGVAIVRPPGHHAEEGYPCGFCIFNNVALAAKYALETHDLKRILIVDWDVHHGNGIQRMFESDPRVLYISIHRYDNGFFFPCSPDANYNVVGQGQGSGFTVNIPWNCSKMGDTEYLAVFTNIILPIAYEFNPQLVLVSAGFDAAKGDPLGGCSVTPEGYAHMTHLLRPLANGKVIIALEGGYNLTSIAYSMVLCTKALLGDPIPPLTLNKKIHPAARQSIENVLNVQSKFWTVLTPFRKFLTHKRRLVPFGTYDGGKSLEATMENLELQNNNLTADENELTVPCSSTALSESSSTSPDRGGNNSSFEQSPVKQSPETFTMTLQLGNEEEEGACGGGSKHIVVMSNFDDASPAAVYPLSWCPHVDQVQKVLNEGRINTCEKCGVCGHEGDNLVCLVCYKVLCGRYVNQHMVMHSSECGHPIALSFADLSIWCYACESYVRNEKLFEAFAAAHKDKFNEEPPARSFSTS
ncbi:histone deacetylase 6 isoform X3 [Folsomia candida]|nr:histone deacetylase 6 isoform X3 [Folsomia candida]XP_035701531.1 histone deacetylase 6 isoform X3 [Folsomia candida]